MLKILATGAPLPRKQHYRTHFKKIAECTEILALREQTVEAKSSDVTATC